MPLEDIQGLLGNPMFQMGMGLMQHRADRNYSIPQAIAGGLGASGQYSREEEERLRQEKLRQQAQGLLAGGDVPPPAPGTPQGVAGGVGGTPSAGTGASAMPPQQPAAPGGDRMREIYGMMAQVDPMAALQGYAGYTQRQEELAMQDTPMEQALRLYGNINPHDFTTTSIQSFQDHLTKTGKVKFDKLQRVNELSTREQGYLNDANNNIGSAESSLARMNNIEERFRRAGESGVLAGWAGKSREFLKEISGGEDALTQLRTEFHQLKVKNTLDDLPPGAASEKDVEIVMSGWPEATADPEYIADFLRTMQKLQAVDLARNKHRAQYIARNNGESGLAESWQASKDAYIWQELESLQQPQPAPGLPMSTPPPAAAPAAPPAATSGTARRRQRQGRGTTPAKATPQQADDMYKKYNIPR